MGKLRKLEALRGFAALYVVLHHSVPHDLRLQGLYVGWLLRFGQEAVILFFLISGFVINYSFVRSTDRGFSTFFSKRAARIYIPLWLVFAVHYLLARITEEPIVDSGLNVMLLNLLMLQDVSALKPGVIVAPYLGNTPLWSLSYEWWFYMGYFVLATRLRSATSQRLVVFGAGLLAAALYMVWPHFLIRLPMYLCIWWVGVELSNIYLSGARLSLRLLSPAIVGLFSISLLLSANAYLKISAGSEIILGAYPLLEVRHFVFALIALLAALAWNRLDWAGFDTTVGRFALVAPISYALYIVHYNVMVGSLQKVLQVPAPWHMVFLVAIAIAIAYCIEVVAYPRMRRLFAAIGSRFTVSHDAR